MPNYYEILGLDPGAGIVEIKAAFRQLAKLYHPDKNPEGKEYFEKILKAYETLTDPLLKTSYDHKLSHGRGSEAIRPPQGKRPRQYDERELKRRQYYNEHIRKYAKDPPPGNTRAETEKTYNEFKYILFATPLAVLLFILIMTLAMPGLPEEPDEAPAAEIRASSVEEKPALETGASLYTGYFGTPVYDSIEDRVLNLRNHTGMEVIVCLFAGKDFVRSFYIGKGKSHRVSQLPRDPLHIRFTAGSSYDSGIELKQAGTYGAFSKGRYYFKRYRPFSTGYIENEMTLFPPQRNDDFMTISETEFFNKNDHDKKN